MAETIGRQTGFATPAPASDREARTQALLESLEERILVLDGATGTALQGYQLTAADFGGPELEGCNENLCALRPDVVLGLHRHYLAAGADVVETNSFGATPLVLSGPRLYLRRYWRYERQIAAQVGGVELGHAVDGDRPRQLRTCPREHDGQRHAGQGRRSDEESGERAGYDGAKRKKGSKVHMAVDTLGNLLALYVTPANEQDRQQVDELARRVQEATGDSIQLAYVDQGYTGEAPQQAAQAHGIHLEVVKLPDAKRDFVLLPRRWVVERSFGWMTRFRRLVRDFERLPKTLIGLDYLAFAMLMLRRCVQVMAYVL